ncbi:uncharacterized protein LOC141649275 [Silene latifolia]|uniref:uncharacterized protein LOC141649275 n=1 Tax=Silene latifolia TaxID=37657 RepID=UPI003D778AA7
MGFRYFNILNNYAHHDNGRAWVIWNKASLVVTPLSTGNQWVHVQIEAPGCTLIQVSFVYGLNSMEGRMGLWSFMQSCHPNVPWLCLGDFNCVRSTEERISSNPPNLHAIDEFNEAISLSGLDALSTHGCIYTWTNKQDEGDRKWMRLDRALVNLVWDQQFPSSFADALEAGVSDHSPLVVTVQHSDTQRPKQFRYLNCWGQDSSFATLVRGVWKEDVRGCTMYKLVSHLKLAKGKLKALHKGKYSNVTDRATEAKAALLQCQTRIQNDPLNVDLLNLEVSLLDSYCKLKNAELSMVYQRAKIFDVKMMDANTSFFFAKLAAKRSRSHISKIKNMAGVECNPFEGISEAFLDYYKSLLGTESQVKDFDSDIILKGNCLNQDQRDSLSAEVTEAEIHAALFSIDVNKSPGPDGLSSGFFRQAWSIIKLEFVKAIQDFFRTGKLLKEVNATIFHLFLKETLLTLYKISDQSRVAPLFTKL